MVYALTMADPMQAWRYRPWVQEYVDQQLKVMARHGRPTIGFHVRGGNLTHPENSRVNPGSCLDVVHATACCTENRRTFATLLQPELPVLHINGRRAAL